MKRIAIILMMVFALSLTACQDSSASSGDTSSSPTITSNEYIANKNSRKLHYYTCDSLPAEHNRVYFSSEAAANNAGYTDNHKECMGK